MLIVMTVALGVIYPFAVWGVGQAIFPAQANGSLIVRDGKVIGSELIGQNFTSAERRGFRLRRGGLGRIESRPDERQAHQADTG